jgi:CheY-like chemotaxis protein
MRILYVDDDRINGLLFEEACRLAGGVELQLAVDGAEALETVRRWTPDVLVVDLHLPDTDGLSLLSALRALPNCARLPTFLCTADDSQEVRTKALDAGCLDCWTKPIELRAMLHALSLLRPGAGAS